jgi:hypothetical protein
MTILPIIVIGAYFFSLLLVWSKSHSMAAGWPIFLLNMNRRMVFMGITSVLAYGSIIGIAYFISIWLALAALVFKFVVGRVSFHHYFKHAVAEHAEWEYQQMLKDRANAGAPLEQLDTMARFMRLSSPDVDFNLDESAMRQEAYRRARQAVQDRVMRG